MLHLLRVHEDRRDREIPNSLPATPTPKPHEDQACDGEEEVEDRKPGVHTRRGDGGAEGVIRNADARYGVLCTIVREQICERILACLVGEYDGPSEVLLNWSNRLRKRLADLTSK